MIALELETKITGHRIDITSQSLPDYAERARVIVLLPDNEEPDTSIGEPELDPSADFMRLSLDERRQVMAQQAEQLLDHYAQAMAERQEWQAGEFHDAH